MGEDMGVGPGDPEQEGGTRSHVHQGCVTLRVWSRECRPRVPAPLHRTLSWGHVLRVPSLLLLLNFSSPVGLEMHVP